MGRAWLSLLRFSWLLLLLFVWLTDRLLLVMLFVSRKFLILLLVRRQRSLIKILCLFSVSVIRLMLTRQSIIVNQKRLVNYEQCRYLCKNKQDFCDNLSPEGVIEFSLLCDSLGLELVERRVDYYLPEHVGRFSPYFQGCKSSDSDSFGLSDSERESYLCFTWDADSVADFCSRIIPVQLELPYESL